MNKTIFNLFAALAFIFAALATPSASAYGALYVIDGTAGAYGLALDQPDAETARMVASQLCSDRANGATCDATTAADTATEPNSAQHAFEEDGENTCFALYVNEDNFYCTITFDTKAAAESAERITACGFVRGGTFQRIDLETELGITNTCDRTCTGDMVPNMDNEIGCRAVATPDDCLAVGNRDGHNNIFITEGETTCRAAATADECVILSVREQNDKTVIDEDGVCVEPKTCEGRTIDGNADGVPNVANGLCMACPDNTLDLGVTCGGCFPGFVENAASEDGCRAAANSDDCQTIDDTMPIYANGDCVSATSDADCANAGFSVSLPMAALTGGCVAAVVPEFRYQIGEMTVIASEDTPLSVNVSVAAALSINIAASVDNTLSYSSDSEGQLMVSPAGIVGFVAGVTISVGVHRIEIIAAEDNTPIMTIGMYLTVAAAAAEPNEEEAVSVVSSASSSNKNKTGIIVGLLMLGVYIANTDATAASAIRWTPSYAFSGNNGNVSYSVGSRWTATTDDWRYYWQTATANGGEFVYGSGMNWNNGIVAANIDSETDATTTDLDMSIAATKTAGMWRLYGGYHAAMQISDTETDAQNRLNLSAGYYLDRWLLSATANTDGNQAAARVNYSYRF